MKPKKSYFVLARRWKSVVTYSLTAPIVANWNEN